MFRGGVGGDIISTKTDASQIKSITSPHSFNLVSYARVRRQSGITADSHLSPLPLSSTFILAQRHLRKACHLLTSTHPHRRLIPLTHKPRLLLLSNNLLLLLDESTALAESAEEAVGHAVAFDVVGLADFRAFHECEAVRGGALARTLLFIFVFGGEKEGGGENVHP
jgi:hypothetical protein